MAKKNLLKLPRQLIERIKTFELDDVVVACVKKLLPADVPRYRHLGIALNGNDVVAPPPTVPPAKAGRYSRANVEGKEVVRRDLPMTKKTYSWDSPQASPHSVTWE
jgi:hypothetical protein